MPRIRKYRYNPYRWHFVTGKQIPHWIRHKWELGRGGDFPLEGTITNTEAYARGKHYEYKFVAVIFPGTTHFDAIIRRKLKKHHHKK
jgi:hypothetical protein